MESKCPKIIFFANTEWYLYNFRLSLAKRLRSEGFDVLLISPPGEYGKRLEEEGFRWHSLPMDRRSLNPWQEIRLIRYLVKLYRSEEPDIVHNFTVKCAIYGSIAAFLAGVPARVNAIAGMGYVFTNSGLRARLLRPVVRYLLRIAMDNGWSRLILQNGDDVSAFQREKMVARDRIRLIKGSGVDIFRFQPASEPVLSGDETRVLLAARLLWDKGIGEYVEAARILRDAGLRIRCLLAGSPDVGNPASVSQEQLDAWAREGLIDLLGHVDDMARLLTQIDIMVLPTSYGEGVPKSLIEAAACGLPIVTTYMPGCRELITDGVNGLLIPVRDAGALADAIRRLHEQPDWARHLGQAARTKVLAEFDERIVIDKTLKVYRELLPAADQGSAILMGNTEWKG